VSLPRPEPGLVIRYFYLWAREHREGREDGVKDRPCAIVIADEKIGEAKQVVVIPVTHSPPENNAAAIEIPPAIKKLLRLDTQRSWIILSESNSFSWPGPDLHRVGARDNSSVAYGFLPPRFFAEVIRRFVELEAAARSRRVPRTE
jgi:PemK-like, MazF-like toxin of type II toxin-antitoxin system